VSSSKRRSASSLERTWGPGDSIIRLRRLSRVADGGRGVPPGRVVADGVRDDTYVSTPEAEGCARRDGAAWRRHVLPGSEREPKHSGDGDDEGLRRTPAEAH
jgi:hypothetical protein